MHCKKAVKRSSFIYLLTRRVAKFIFSIFYRFEIERNSGIPEDGPVIILPKHQFWTDIPIVSLVFKSLLYFVAKKELFKYPLIRDYLSLLGGIPVDRKESIKTLRSFRYILSLLKIGEKIVIFPEGKYFRHMVGSGKSRLLRMILRFQNDSGVKIPFIPVGIRYGERKGLRRRVEIKVGRPLFAENGCDAVLFTSRLIEEISRLSGLPLYKE